MRLSRHLAAFALLASLLGSAAGQSAAAPEMVTNPSAVPSGATSVASKIGLNFSKLGATIPGDATLTDDEGKTVSFTQVLGRRPVLLMPLFFRCQTACPLETDNLLKVLIKEEGENNLRRLGAQAAGIDVNELRRERHLLVGRDFDVVFLSIHPHETPADAKRRRLLVEDNFSEGWQKLKDSEKTSAIASVRGGFHYLVGKPEEVRKITDAMGFRFFYDEAKNQMNHPAASVMLSANGKIVGYITGTDYTTRVLADKVDLATRNEVGPLGDTMLFGCIMVDPVSGKYTLVFNQILKVGCVLTLFAVALSIFVMSRKAPNRPVVLSTPGDSPERSA